LDLVTFDQIWAKHKIETKIGGVIKDNEVSLLFARR